MVGEKRNVWNKMPRLFALGDNSPGLVWRCQKNACPFRASGGII
jgi:hypothetical protein